jgi:diguanylate cyclase (GGDEF)-like protein/PAS domain S-box-containing protein
MTIFGMTADSETASLSPLVTALLAHSPDLLAVISSAGEFSYVSPASRHLVGVESCDLIGQKPAAIAHPSDVELFDHNLAFPGAAPVTLRLRHVDKLYRTFEVVFTDLRAVPNINGVLLSARDISGRIRAEQELKRRREIDRVVRRISTRFAMSAVDATPSLLFKSLTEITNLIGATRASILVSDPDSGHLLERVGPTCLSVVPFTRPVPITQNLLEGISSKLAMAEVVTTYAFDTDRRLIDAVELPDLEPIQGLVYIPLRAGEELLGIMLVTSADPAWRCPADTQGVLRTVGEICAGALARQRAEETLAAHALRDPLTGLPNRRFLMERLEQAITKTSRSTSSVGLLFIDCDDFKDVNDTLGHEEGDELLLQLARRLESVCRVGEVATRFGGDEFVVMVESSEPESAVIALGERIVATLREPYNCGGQTVRITVSVGAVVQNNDEAVVASDLLRRADTAMYRAKNSGRNCLAIFTLDMEERARKRFELVSDLRQAVRNPEQFKVWYQPLFRVSNSALVGFEALVRWNHPRHGLLFPDAFIDVAEESGLIKELGVHVLERSLQDFDDWRKRQTFVDIDVNASIAVNLCVHQLLSSSFLNDLKALLRSSSVPPNQITLEITESVFANRDAVLPPLVKLRDLGVKIAVDDFGTGYSSLAYLRDLPVDLLKIDRTFVNRLGSNARDEAVVGTLITLANQLSLTTVAEGVETQTQFDSLRRLGCDHAQGYLLGRPMPMDRLLPLDELSVVNA